MANAIDNTQDVIDSRDIIARIEELEDTQSDLMSDVEQDQAEHDEYGTPETLKALEIAKVAFAKWEAEEGLELDQLREVRQQAEGYGDWEYGESLVHVDYFTQYTEDLIKDCYDMPTDLGSGKWPFKHMKMDYEAAAEEAKQDYMEVNYAGVTYLMRSV